MSLGTHATTAILTKGLSCGNTTGCESGTIITTKFGLFCKIEITPPPVMPAGGGSRVFAPGEIQNFYKPVEQPYVIPLDKEKDYFNNNSQHVKIMIKIGKIKTEREYVIPKNKTKYIIKILKVINNTINSIKVNINSIKRITNDIIIKIKLRK